MYRLVELLSSPVRLQLFPFLGSQTSMTHCALTITKILLRSGKNRKGERKKRKEGKKNEKGMRGKPVIVFASGLVVH